MINLRLIETNFDEFNKKLKAKKVDDGVLSELLDTYDALKKAKSQLENLQNIQNLRSKELGIRAKNGENLDELKEILAQNKKLIATASQTAQTLESKLEYIAVRVPNIIDDDVPFGADENENVCLKEIG